MIDLRLLNLQEGDSQADVANKLNYNFNQIVNAGDGAYGPVGIPGVVGSYGATGITGPAGFQGQRGNFWFVQETGPTAGVTGGDYWIDLANDCEVFEWVKSDGAYSWVSQGFLLSQSGVFEIAASTTGLTSGYPTQAYVIALPSPAEKTLVLSGASGPNVKNPQLSRVMIETGGTTGFPLLEFSKYNYQSNSAFNSLTPKMKWYTTNTGSSDAYGLNLEARGGLGFNVANFNGVAYNDVRFTDGSIVSGITGAFSSDLNYYAATGDFRIGTTLSINSANAVWNNVGFTGPVSFSATTGVDRINSGRNTLMVQNGITYNRTTSYTTGQNILSVKYSGSSSYSEYGPYLASPNNFYLADSDGNNKFSKKTSGYFPNPKTVSSSNNTGGYTWSGKITATQSFYTVGAAITPTTNSKMMRHQIGEFFHPDLYTSGSVSEQALVIFIPNQYSSSRTGYGYLVDSASQSMTFRVNTTSSGRGFNAIILDAPNFSSDPSTYFSLTAGAKKDAVLLGDLVTGGDENTYADQFEFSIVKMGFELKVYFKAWGGNLKNYTTNDSAIVCGCVSTTS
jgi:hypothetical protein